MIAWLWARTVKCPNPACRMEAPLVQSWLLSSKPGKQVRILPKVVPAATGAGRAIEYTICHNQQATAPGTVSGSGARCLACDSSIELKYIRSEGRADRIGSRLIAVVAQGKRGREYLPPTQEHERAARVQKKNSGVPGNLPEAALGFRVQAYGMTSWSHLFTDRQLIALTTICDIASDLHTEILMDGISAGLSEEGSLVSGGTGARAYADAVLTYLGLAISRLTDWSNSLCRWESKGQVSQQLFGQQSIPMVWDYSEAMCWPRAADPWMPR